MKRPISVTILGVVFIAAGLVGIVYHLSERPVDASIVLVTFVRLLAVVGGVFLLMGHSWARWLLVAWLALHVVVSGFHSLSEMAAHAVLLVVVVYFLFTPPASRYFRPAPPG
jgi:uncharacterized membrane protein HdeD (DUF308 family)